MHVYRLRVTHVATASVGRRREVGREEVVAMARAALRASQEPQEVGEVEPEPDRIVHGEPWIRQQPDPDPAATGSRSGFCRI